MTGKVDWSKWSPTFVAVGSVIAGLSGALAKISEVERDLVFLRAQIDKHTMSEGHINTIRRVDMLESQQRFTDRSLDRLNFRLEEQTKLLLKIDKRTEMLCSESAKCRSLK